MNKSQSTTQSIRSVALTFFPVFWRRRRGAGKNREISLYQKFILFASKKYEFSLAHSKKIAASDCSDCNDCL
ncbi:hypothetical protein LEP1GSC190_04005 [Leptospira mayottensis 200901116]|nr:hypothetical protein LEP1GSC190_04005 [Leptospira mayottensis 200901116]